MKVELSIGDIELLSEALQMSAGRHASSARFRPSSAGPHDRKAEAMRELRARLMLKERFQKA